MSAVAEYFIQEHQLSNTTRTVVKDVDGKSLFLMVGRWSGVKGDLLSVYAMNGTLLASIKQASVIVGRKFVLYDHFDKIGVLQKIFNWPGDFYYIKQLQWAVHGDIHNHQYSINHLNHPIMKMDKASLIWGDYYVLDVTHEEDAPICICIAAIMDYWSYNRKRKPRKSRYMYDLDVGL
jgi:uncharacterized protein YxjI